MTIDHLEEALRRIETHLSAIEEMTNPLLPVDPWAIHKEGRAISATLPTLRAQLAGEGWRDISDAGDDILHKEVLVSNPKHYDCIVGIKSHLAETFLSEREQEKSELSEDDLWQIDWFDAKTGERLEDDIAPTHFRLFPAPPAQTDTLARQETDDGQ